MQINEQAPSYIRNISAYVPGKPISELAREYGLNESAIIKLASNENPLGASPKAQEAIGQVLHGLERYPDGNGFELKRALVELFAVKAEQIVLGNGSNDVLELAAHTFLTPGQSVVCSQYAFAVYTLASQAAGAEVIEVPARDYAHDLDAMLKAIRPDTRLLFIGNPNNPTGTLIKEPDLKQFLDAVPAEVLVVLDEAYTEYLPPEYASHAIQWIEHYPNLLVLRTFSKIYGLAGLRVGYGIAHPAVADLINRVRQPFNVSSVAQVAATAALKDSEFVSRSCHFNQEGMKLVTSALERLGLQYIPSFANFVMFKVPDAAEVNEYLLRHGVIVRPLASYKMPDCLRVTIGKPEENVRFISVLARALS